VGESAALKEVLSRARIVAPLDATVLILGETGTGKELIARAIHRMSSRKHASFIKLNCAAIPAGLLESELFGHEKGAFTGSVGRKIGRLELADTGTLFLDELGELPAEVQPKLLRALEDQEFERLGSTHTIRVNMRLIAATNQNLAKRVADGQFRRDLFYRVNVFPIRVPPLRERKEDIPLLVHHLVQKFARMVNKQIDIIPAETMDALLNWAWPGNVRELENFMERSVIRSKGPILNVPLSDLGAPSVHGESQ
jgi:formate hydrogenlyase transcriptional activator